MHLLYFHAHKIIYLTIYKYTRVIHFYMRPPAPLPPPSSLSPRLTFSYLLLINIYWNSTKIIKKKPCLKIWKTNKYYLQLAHDMCGTGIFFLLWSLSHVCAVYFGKHDLFGLVCEIVFFCSLTTNKAKDFFRRAHFFVITNKLAPNAFLKKKIFCRKINPLRIWGAYDSIVLQIFAPRPCTTDTI